jgi:hypothetical protein
MSGMIVAANQTHYAITQYAEPTLIGSSVPVQFAVSVQHLIYYGAEPVRAGG